MPNQPDTHFRCIFCGRFCDGHRAGEFTRQRSWTGRYFTKCDAVCYRCCDCGTCESDALRREFYASA